MAWRGKYTIGYAGGCVPLRSPCVSSISFGLSISAEEFQRLYQGSVRDVVALADDGRRLRFPAAILRPYVLHDGVRGRFRLHFDEHNRFQSIERLA